MTMERRKEVTKFYTGMLWPKVKDLSISVFLTGKERLSFHIQLYM